MADLQLGPSAKHENGLRPFVCVNDKNTVVQVRHLSGENDLWYCVGKIERGGVISWGETLHYDTYGLHPRLAINNEGTVVQMHQSLIRRYIYSKVGVVKERKIVWGESQLCGDGMNPAIALLDDGTVICVYLTSFLGSYSTHCRVGSVNVENKCIEQWGNPAHYGRGNNLALAANRDGIVVEVHEKLLGLNTLQYRVGKLQRSPDQRQIAWGEEVDCAEGGFPSVALNADDQVLEVHQSATLRRLFYRSGNVNRETSGIDWAYDSTQYDLGKYPSVCLNGSRDRNVVEAHETNLGKSVWCRTGTLK